MLYHEKQVAALCGVHTINTLLQGPYFNELDLAQIGHELDALEREMLGEEGAAAAGEHGNLDDSGMFSVQVLDRALQTWGLTALPVDSEELRNQAGGFVPQQEQAFICNLQEHWFTIRRVGACGDCFWNLNSLYPAPEELSPFYLTAYLDSLKGQGYTIFCIRGQLPQSAAAAGGEADGPGKWWDPEEAREAHRTAAQTRQSGRARNAMEAALTRAAASGGAITLRPSGKRPAASQAEDDEDADLAAAIAASMQDHAGAGGAGPSSYAAAARRAPAAAAAAAAAAAGSPGPSGGGFEGGMQVDEDDDPELAAALAASLEEHHNQQQQQQQEAAGGDATAAAAPQPQQQPEQQVAVPEEPADGADGAVTVAFRLPSGGRLSRRFLASDTVAVLQAYVQQQLAAEGGGGTAAAAGGVALSTQFPRRPLDEPTQTLAAAGIEDRSVLGVAFA